MPPSNKTVATMEGEGVEQLQPTALDSEEIITTGTYAKDVLHVHMCDYTCEHVCVHLTKIGYVVPHHNDNMFVSQEL